MNWSIVTQFGPRQPGDPGRPKHWPTLRFKDIDPTLFLRHEQPWAFICPVRLTVGDEVWVLSYEFVYDEDSKRWWIVEEGPRFPAVIEKVPPAHKRKGGQYMVRCLGGGPQLAVLAWEIDYVQPYDECGAWIEWWNAALAADSSGVPG